MDKIISQTLTLADKYWQMLLENISGIDIDIERVIALLGYDARQPLLFNTGLFLVLFALFLIVYRALRPWRVARMLFTICVQIYCKLSQAF